MCPHELGQFVRIWKISGKVCIDDDWNEWFVEWVRRHREQKEKQRVVRVMQEWNMESANQRGGEEKRRRWMMLY